MKQSAGLLLYKFQDDSVRVLLVHPGGPFWKNKDDGAWSIPKGEFDAGEDPLIAAKREFREETGHDADGEFIPLEPLRQKSGKVIHAWACKGDLDPSAIASNTFELEWPPYSGRMQAFPEVDRAGWFTMKEAQRKIVPGQAGFLAALQQKLNTH
jgi:predicted NUDIX family NTP pyrophosphohydrolase